MVQASPAGAWPGRRDRGGQCGPPWEAGFYPGSIALEHLGIALGLDPKDQLRRSVVVSTVLGVNWATLATKDT